jgi:membrane fusion protein (multidrug efflux system)
MQAQLQSKANPYTDSDVAAAIAGVEQAQAALSVAQSNLDQTILTAPWSGVVGTKLLTPGAFTSATAPIMTLVGNAVEVHITVEEARLGLVAPGQTVSLTVPAYPGVNFPGMVTVVAPVGDARAHTFDVTIVADQSDGRLRSGMFSEVDLTVAQKPNAVLVPKEAVVQQGGNSRVFVVQDGKAQARPVQVGLTNDKSVEIVSGVSEGEQVVVVGQNGLRDGTDVTTPPQNNQGARGQGGQGGQGARTQGGQGGQGNQGQNQGGQPQNQAGS